MKKMSYNVPMNYTVLLTVYSIRPKRLGFTNLLRIL